MVTENVIDSQAIQRENSVFEKTLKNVKFAKNFFFLNKNDSNIIHKENYNINNKMQHSKSVHS